MRTPRSPHRSPHLLISACLGVTGALAATASSAHAQALPSPRDFVSSLDLECYRTPGPSMNVGLTLTHLNPALLQLGLPAHPVMIRELAQTCVPVRKNNGGPAPSALPFVQHVDFACHRIEAAALPATVPVNLTHLNPVLANLPQHNVQLVRPVQLCVPVYKNTAPPPPAVRAFVQYLDLECWETIAGPHPNFTVGLSQLNPQLLGIPQHQMSLVPEPRQLCVPVRKGNQVIPQQFLDIIQWTDVEKFRALPLASIAPVNVTLRHLNPLFTGRPPVEVVLQEATSLMVPVAKNNWFPPID